MTRSLAGSQRQAATLPEWIAPQFTPLVDAAPEGDEWLHEINSTATGCMRALIVAGCGCLTRIDLDRTHKYPPIAAEVSSLGARQA
jgi:bifunctional non-homologous end joining protein LigD